MTFFYVFLHSRATFINFVVMDNKTLINKLSEKLDRDPEDVEVLVDSMCSLLIERIKEGDIISMPGFGLFEPKMRAERIVSHPSTGKKILVPPKMSMVFKPSALLKQKVRNS